MYSNLILQRVFTSLAEYGCIVRQEELRGQRLPWKDWKYYEALRRTISVFRIVFQLFDINIDLPCPRVPGFAVAPLPANKLLWRADTEERWEREWEDEVKETPIHAITTNGDFLKLRNGVTPAHGRKIISSKYYAGADELGLLVLLLAHLRDSPLDIGS
jgi:hypothetical protein